jgi:excisionase family DNA binding protein
VLQDISVFEDKPIMSEKQISPDRKLLTEKEAAEYMRASRQTLWRMRKNNGLKFYRLYSKVLYDRADLDELINRHARCIAA